MTTRMIATVSLIGTTLGAVLLSSSTARASEENAAQHLTIPPTYTITCNDGTVLAPAGGVFDVVVEQGNTGSGNFHITGTVTPRDVQLRDVSGTAYRLAGASWFGGTVNSTTGGTVLSSTDHFQLLAPDGGTAGSILTTEHVSPNGNVVSVDIGSCELPAGG
jgi:hypothetical protein